MKKLICILLVLSMALSMAGCKTENRGEAAPTGGATTPVATTPSATEPEATKGPDATIEETVIYDDNDIKLTLKALTLSDPKYHQDITLTMIVENNSEQTIEIQCLNMVVNGITFAVYINGCEKILPGKKAVGELVPDIVFLDFGITGLDKVATLMTDCIIIYGENNQEIGRCGFDIRTSIADTLEFEPCREGEVIYEDENFLVKYQGSVDLFPHNSSHLFFVENKSDTFVDVNLDDICANDVRVNAWGYTYVYPGTVGYATLHVDDVELRKVGLTIELLEKLSFTVDFRNWETGYGFTTPQLDIFLAQP